MLGRYAAIAALIALAGCAGFQSAGRNSGRGATEPIPTSAPMPRAAPVAPPPSYVAPPPSQTPPAQTAQAQQPPVAAPSVSVAPPPPAPRADDNADVTVQAPARQVQAPRGDPRSVSERREDIQRWDTCVMQVQQTYASDPLEPETETPEEVCRRQLGQADRSAVPTSRLVRPH